MNKINEFVMKNPNATLVAKGARVKFYSKMKPNHNLVYTLKATYDEQHNTKQKHEEVRTILEKLGYQNIYRLPLGHLANFKVIWSKELEDEKGKFYMWIVEIINIIGE